MKTRLMGSVTVAAALLLASCERSQPSPTTPTPAANDPAKTDQPAAAAAPAAISDEAPPAMVFAAGIVFDAPPGWKQVAPANPMRLAEVRVADASGDASRDCLLTVSTAGGDIDMNIDRWTRQMRTPSGEPPEPDVRVIESGGLKVHVVVLEGSYQGMTDPAPLPEWMMRGAIVENPGSATVFIKMTGPAAAMRSISDGWASLVSSIRKP
ncbi:MAG: hypothetical protein KF787_11925 [Phycisphaeraceae bacterium]|nr:hypothetical protein [Phycisphaerae bacterium]MBX3393343.1 hypothetical protein [Phycisphaeraceae bacterium]